ncbi:hypothetical protein G4B88_010340 [Cannabis sativa]|uniref:Uncharacterized protein n=1 Tax=Cannabis sativa TaxID=3483 RepID=A0A7J6I791_CANSA|nr:hypothetical protein G4B88_010340 [Cannabis sativa]
MAPRGGYFGGVSSVGALKVTAVMRSFFATAWFLQLLTWRKLQLLNSTYKTPSCAGRLDEAITVAESMEVEKHEGIWVAFLGHLEFMDIRPGRKGQQIHFLSDQSEIQIAFTTSRKEFVHVGIIDYLLKDFVPKCSSYRRNNDYENDIFGG